MDLRKILITATAAIMACMTANAEITPDMNGYSEKLDRFKTGETLGPDEMVTVYYGATRQPGFDAMAQYPAVEQAYRTGNISGAYALAKEKLQSDPTNLNLLFKAYASAVATGEKDSTALQQRLLQVCDAIFASGKGVTEESPYVVTRASDIDEFLIKYLQPQSVNGRSRLGKLDAVKVKFDGIADDVIIYFSIFK